MPNTPKTSSLNAAKVSLSAHPDPAHSARELLWKKLSSQPVGYFRVPEFVMAISSEANEICEKESKKTMTPEHVLAALKVSERATEQMGQPFCH